MTDIIYNNYFNKFNYILVGLKNDLKKENQGNYIELLNNEDIVSSLFKDTARDISEYSDIYDVDIKFIDDIKILCFLSMNFYKVVEKDTSLTKKYLIFHSMLYRFKNHLPNKNYNNKILIKLNHMFKNISSYNELINYNGKFGLFQILKSIYNVESDFTSGNITQNKESISNNIFIKNESLDEIIDDITVVENALGEISANDWDTSSSKAY